MIAAQGLTVNRSSDGKKVLLYIVCFPYSLLSLTLSLLLVVVVVFTLLSY